ncbi:TMV resistance protein N-like [Dorcoceras hygrometricum]|uniref:TMV resistance protein N-like n=1 Tax=Dorcoceras hygrometricum TaxID=472368 RepID=A0A2Z7CM89_9LAMI|nr:TMV resistance protein N-like [Dorcoceras hygrometricum]
MTRQNDPMVGQRYAEIQPKDIHSKNARTARKDCKHPQRLVTIERLRILPLKPLHNQFHFVYTGCQHIHLVINLSSVPTNWNTTLHLLILSLRFYRNLPCSSTPTSRRHLSNH